MPTQPTNAPTAELVASERLFRSTFEAAPIGMAHVAFDGTWMRWNQCLGDMLGYSLADLDQLTGQNFLKPVEDAAAGEAFRRMALGELHRYKIDKKHFLLKNGVSLWTRVNVSVLRDARGEPVHLILVVEDITGETASAPSA